MGHWGLNWWFGDFQLHNSLQSGGFVAEWLILFVAAGCDWTEASVELNRTLVYPKSRGADTPLGSLLDLWGYLQPHYSVESRLAVIRTHKTVISWGFFAGLFGLIEMLLWLFWLFREFGEVGRFRHQASAILFVHFPAIAAKEHGCCSSWAFPTGLETNCRVIDRPLTTFTWLPHRLDTVGPW